jgi:hypothetical protein
MNLFSETLFKNKFNLSKIEQTVESAIRLASQNPTTLYLFFQRYTYFNSYVSSMIPRLTSSIAMSRSLFKDSNALVLEEADRGMQISTRVMVAAADEGAYGISHRSLAQLMLKAVGNYARLSTHERNQFSNTPVWLNEIVDTIIATYQGTPGNIASLIRAMGCHTASEMMGDLEYALLDKIIRYENRGIGFDDYLRNEASPVTIEGHRYDPWCYILIHSKHESSGLEIEHFESALEALNMVASYSSEPEQQIIEWVLQGFKAFVESQQCLFIEIYHECLELLEISQTARLMPAQ